MKILYFNTDGKQVNIGILGDHRLIGNRLCCGCSVAKSSYGLIKLLWSQKDQVKTQQNSIILVIQKRDNGCFVTDVAKAHKGTRTMMTPNGVRLPPIIKNGLPYLKHYYPTARQIKEITGEEWMTSKNMWDPTKLDDIAGASDLSISQFSPIPVNAINSFYNSQDDICATKSDFEVDPAVVDKKRKLEVDPAVVDKKSEGYHTKPTGIKSEGYQSKPKTKNKSNNRNWVNNKKIR